MKIAEAARVLWAGFDGTTVTDHVRELLKLGVGGFTLFARNISTPAQTAELIAEIRSLAPGRRLLFSIDQEGGRVARLREPATVWPPLRVLGQTGDADLAHAFGMALAKEIGAIGFDVDFAPVMDVDTNPVNPVIGDRSLARDTATVSRLGVALIEGLQGEGIWACAKHFPGHGDTDLDSHLALPVLRHERRRWDEVELPPFRAAAAAGVAAMMTAHVIVQAIDADRPATMSARVLRVLREELGYAGVVISDDLEMKAIAANFDLGEAALEAARAGVDVLLCCHTLEHQETIVRALYDAHCRGDLPPLRLAEMAANVARTASRFRPLAKTDLKVLGCDEHQRLAEMIRCRGAG